MTSTIFDPAAAAYDRLRPGYPPALFDGIEQLSGTALVDARVVEVGAGTGIATRALRARGAQVLALDLSLAMLRMQRPAGREVIARGERLPVRTDVADLVCGATSWHWVEPAAGLAEAVRVLRPGGAFAVWWNRLAYRDAPWLQAREAALNRRGLSWTGSYASDYALTALDDDLRASGWFASVQRLDVRWERMVALEDHLTELATHSTVIRLGPEIDDFLDEQRGALAAAFPAGLVRERYHCHLHVARLAGLAA